MVTRTLHNVPLRIFMGPEKKSDGIQKAPQICTSATHSLVQPSSVKFSVATERYVPVVIVTIHDLSPLCPLSHERRLYVRRVCITLKSITWSQMDAAVSTLNVKFSVR